MKALGNEIAKNLVLAGIHSLTILDDALVAEEDLGAQFFLSEHANPIGENRAQAASAGVQKLNPRVNVVADPGSVKDKGASYFQSFDIVIATDLDPDSLNIINTATRMPPGKPFYAAGCAGMFGFLFSDLIEHEFVLQRDLGLAKTQIKPETRTRSVVGVQTRKEGGKTIEVVTKRELYSTWYLASDAASLPAEYLKRRARLRAVTPALSCFRALWEFQTVFGRAPQLTSRDDIASFTRLATSKHAALGLPSETLKSEFLRIFLQNVGGEIAPVAAILGGQLAQDVINVLGRSQQPIQNMVIFDGETFQAEMYALHPEGALGRDLLKMADEVAVITNGAAVVATEASLLGLNPGIAPIELD